MNKFKVTIFGFITLFFVSASVLAPFASAQTQGNGRVQRGTWYNPTLDQFITKVGDAAPNEIFGERYTFAQVNWIINSLFYLLAGPISNCANQSTDVVACLEAAFNSADTGAVLPLARMVDMMNTTKPLSGTDYVAQRLHKLNIIDTTYAQTPDANTAGFGYANSLAVILPLWVGVRDAAYALVIFAILILAFMVMLRAKISPQAAITVQSALPRIAIGLVLITFSYAIAGFMVDLIFVLQGLIAGILSSTTSLSHATAIDIFTSLNDVNGSMFALCGLYIIAFLGLMATVVAIGGAASIGVGPIGLFVGITVSVVVALVFIIMTLVTLCKIFWLQLKTITTILLLVVASPLLMLVGIVQGGTFSSWIKKIFGHLVVFLAIGVMMMLAHTILLSTTDNGGWVQLAANGFGWNKFGINTLPDPKPTAYFPTQFNWGSIGQVGLFISIGIFMSIPSLASAARDSVLHGKGNFGFDSFNTATGGAAGASASALGEYGSNYYGKQASIAKQALQTAPTNANREALRAAERNQGWVRSATGFVRGKLR